MAVSKHQYKLMLAFHNYCPAANGEVLINSVGRVFYIDKDIKNLVTTDYYIQQSKVNIET